jgi:hypothetical protein
MKVKKNLLLYRADFMLIASASACNSNETHIQQHGHCRGFIFPGSRAQVPGSLWRSPSELGHLAIGTMSVLKAAQNANTAFSEIPIMSARSIHT